MKPLIKVILTNHALRRAVRRLQKIYESEMRNGEGLKTWLKRRFVKALIQGSRLDKESATESGIKFVFHCIEKDTFILITTYEYRP